MENPNENQQAFSLQHPENSLLALTQHPFTTVKREINRSVIIGI
jgi:hypothetical protein